MVQTSTHKPRKAGPQSRQGKWIHDIFSAPLKIYNPHCTAILHAQQKARKNRAIPKEANVAGHNRKLQRSRPGSIILISSWTNPYDCITRNLLLSKGYWDVHSTSQFHEIGPWLDGKGDRWSKKAGHKNYCRSFEGIAGSDWNSHDDNDRDKQSMRYLCKQCHLDA